MTILKNLFAKILKLPPSKCLLNLASVIVLAIFFSFNNISCSMPNLEAPECTAARGSAKEFYSYHFGNDMKFTAANLNLRKNFMTPKLSNLLEKFVTETDPLTLTAEQPKAFRIGGCQVIDPAKTDVEVLLFWRDDNRSEQKAIHAEMVKRNDKWLVDNIYNNHANLNNLQH